MHTPRQRDLMPLPPCGGARTPSNTAADTIWKRQGASRIHAHAVRQGELSANDRHRITLLQIGAQVHHVRERGKETRACVNTEHIDLPVGRRRGPRSCLKSHGTNRSPPALGTQPQLQLLRGGLVPSETPWRRGRRIFLARPATPRP